MLELSPWTRMGAKLARAHKLFAATLPAHEHEGDIPRTVSPAILPSRRRSFSTVAFPWLFWAIANTPELR